MDSSTHSSPSSEPPLRCQSRCPRTGLFSSCLLLTSLRLEYHPGHVAGPQNNRLDGGGIRPGLCDLGLRHVHALRRYIGQVRRFSVMFVGGSVTTDFCSGRLAVASHSADWLRSRATLPGIEPGPSVDGVSPNGQGGDRLVQARPGPVFPDVDFNRQPALSMRGWETCRLSSRLQRVGRLSGCPAMPLAGTGGSQYS